MGRFVSFLFLADLIYSFMGMDMGKLLCIDKGKKLVNRGFVTGPVCTIYGVGAMSVYLVLRPLQDHGLWLFLGGIVLATILEYVTSWVMEKALPHKLVGLQRTAV